MSSQPKMHRCLKVPELLFAICAFSEDYELLQLSLTCRDFCSYALDALWSSTREGLAALIRCFPDDVIEEINEGNQESWMRRVRLSVRRIPKAEEWDRVRLYASRMRTLHISDTGFSSGNPTDECYRLFLDHWPYPDQPIFPNLRGATLCPATFKTGSLILAAVAQATPLRDLRIRFDGWTPKHDSEIEEIDKALLACRHSATSVSLNFESVQPTLVMGIADRISSALCRFSSLREADLVQSFPLSSEALSHLALLPDLTKLSFMYTKDYANPQLLAPHPDNFRNLKTLELRISETTGLDEACVLLENLHCTRLETLSIWFNSEPLAARLFDLARSIARFTSLRKLELMSMALEGLLEWQPADPDDWPIQCSSMLSILSPLSRLHRLMISYLPLHVTPDDICNVARFWPELRTLELSASDEFTTTTVRVADLHPLATGCPQLHEIMLPIVGDPDDTEDDGGREPVGEQPEHRGVKIVTVCLRGCMPRRPTPRDKAPLRRMFPQARIEVVAVRVRDGESYGGGAYGGVDYDDFDDDDYDEEDEDGLVESTEGNESDDWY